MSKYPISILPYLEEISNCIWSHNASIMVGAGFSMNARPIGNNKKPFPSWQDLGNKFYQKVRGEKIEEAKYNFFDPLKLAYEVEANFGRPALNYLLKDSIPDLEYLPSDLHNTLLNFPWSDVFTTNYDTLLDRASMEVARNYKIVVNQNDLIHSASPRIIKLHGCFNASTPLIISEEDYRTYPIKYAPFVNTVQQTLLENTLCLIGFSGDDPNFLKWIGWIRDNLGQSNSPKIYLIGMLGLSASQEKALSQYNITCVDMSLCPELNSQDHKKGIEYFFDYIKSNKIETVDWEIIGEFSKEIKKSPFPKNISPSEDFEAKSSEIVNLTRKWSNVRGKYPNWLIVPEKIRSQLYQRTRSWQGYINDEDPIDNKVKFEFIYEYLWRKEKCLLPIWDDEIQVIETLVDYYIKALCKVTSSIEGMDVESLKNKISYLMFALSRYYREEGKLNEWNTYFSLIVNRLDKSKYANEIEHEQALQFLFDGDRKQLEICLMRWNVSQSTAYWMYKKSGLLAKLGQFQEAKTLLNSALVKIKKHINETNVINQYSHVSLESYVLLLLNYIENALDWTRNNDDEIQSRLDFLKRYSCDPRGEINSLEKDISHKFVTGKFISSQNSFDVGFIDPSDIPDDNVPEVENAFHLLRFFEDTGIPYQIKNTTLGAKGVENAIKRIANVAPNWAMATMLQLGSSKTVKVFFTREKLNTMTVESIDEIALKYISRLTELCEINDANNLSGKVLPEALSRLCCKCSISVKEDILNLLIRIYSTEYGRQFADVKTLVKRLIYSLSDLEIINYLPNFVELSYLYVSNIQKSSFQHYFNNPFYYIENISNEVIKSQAVKIDAKKISSLLKFIKSDILNERDNATQVLISLYNFSILNKNQHKALNSTLLSQTDEFGIPNNTNYYKAAFNEVLIEQDKYKANLKNYLLESTHLIQNEEPNPNAYTLTSRPDLLCNEMVISSSFLKWDKNEQIYILKKLIAWWNADKKYLLEKRAHHDIKAEFKARFSLIPQVICSVITKEGFEEHRNDLLQMVNDFKIHDLPYIYLDTILFNLVDKERIKALINNSISSDNKCTVVDTFKSIHYLIKIESPIFDDVIGNVFQFVKYDKSYNLIYGLEVIKNVIIANVVPISDQFEDIIINQLTRINKGIKELTIEENLDLQKLAAKLAYVIDYHSRYNNDAMNEVLLSWKQRCLNENEFSEIKKQWLQ